MLLFCTELISRLTIEFFSIVPLMRVGTTGFNISTGSKVDWDLARWEII